MKKLFSILIVLFLGVALFAEQYKVIEVIGTVRYESQKGVLEDVKVGQIFPASTQIKTGLNSSLKVQLENGKEITIKAKQSGPIDNLVIANIPSKGGLKKQTIAKSDAVDCAFGVREGVATASARASEAKEDFTWDE